MISSGRYKLAFTETDARCRPTVALCLADLDGARSLTFENLSCGFQKMGIIHEVRHCQHHADGAHEDEEVDHGEKRDYVQDLEDVDERISALAEV
jgi:hypothetical protein